jgi:hypothetical protein
MDLAESDEDMSFRDLYPHDLANLIGSIRPEWETGQRSGAALQIKNSADLRKFTTAQDRASALTRQLLSQEFLQTHSKIFNKNMEGMGRGPNGRFYNPSPTSCSDCFGFPKGTQFVRVNTPVFQLLLVCIEEKFRSVNVASD